MGNKTNKINKEQSKSFSIPFELENMKLRSTMLKSQINQVGKKIKLKIATFNYGHCDSPFQYYSPQDANLIQEGVFQSLEKLFISLLKKQINSEDIVLFEDKSIKSIDQLDSDGQKDLYERIKTYDRRYRRDKYSPLYYQDVGIQEVKFLNKKKTFKKIWKNLLNQSLKRAHFRLYSKNFEEIDSLAFQILCKYDWVCFQILILYSVSEEINLKDTPILQTETLLNKILSQNSSAKYWSMMTKEFDKNVINQKYKIGKLINSLRDSQIDIFFLQNINNQIINEISRKTQQYRIAFTEGMQSAILISWRSVQKINPQGPYLPLDSYNLFHFSHKHSIKLDAPPSLKRHQVTQYGQFFSQDRSIIKLKEAPHENPEQAPLSKSPFQSQNCLIVQMNKIQNFQQNIHQKSNDSSNSSDLFDESSNSSYLQKQLDQDSASSSDDQNEEKNLNLIDKSRKIQKELLIKLKKAVKRKISVHLLEQLQKLNGAYIQFLDRLILISWQLEKNDISLVEEVIEKIRYEFPQHEIIIGSEVQKARDVDYLNFNENQISFFPGKDNSFQKPFKRQTFLRIQTLLNIFGYSDRENIKSKIQKDISSHLISTAILENKQIININGEQMSFNKNTIIPSDLHPYQNFMVSAQVTYPELNTFYHNFKNSINIIQKIL